MKQNKSLFSTEDLEKEILEKVWKEYIKSGRATDRAKERFLNMPFGHYIIRAIKLTTKRLRSEVEKILDDAYNEVARGYPNYPEHFNKDNPRLKFIEELKKKLGI